MIRSTSILLLLALCTLAGCATYRTPGAGVELGSLSGADDDIAELLQRKPASPFPANIAIARAQSSGYYSNGNSCWGKGSYCVVTARDLESEDDLRRLQRLPMVAGVAPLNRIVLPATFNNLRDLRGPAAHLHSDLLLVYSFDTRFNIENTDVGPLQLISLGFLPTKKAHVTTTASAALIDVRSGYLYGVAEASARQQQRSTSWTSGSAVDNARMKTEAQSFQMLLDEFEVLWKAVVEAHASTNAVSANAARKHPAIYGSQQMEVKRSPCQLGVAERTKQTNCEMDQVPM